MSNININKQGQFIIDRNNIKYLVNNFSQSGNTTGWTLTNGTLTNGVVTMTGSNPTIYSPYFNVNKNDIICIEFTVSLPTPSDPGGAGKGLYLGTPTSQGVFVHSFNPTTKVWTASSSANNNPYFLNAYNLTTALTQKHYVLGASVNLSDVPWGETTNTSYPPKAIQLPSNITTCRIRSGYNSNPSMIITLSNPRIYNIKHDGFYSGNDIVNASIGQNWSQALNIYEY